jgi:hypothetical protein
MYGTCKICGCTDNNACRIPGEENCHWVNEEHDLCSHCVTAFIAVKGKLVGTLKSKRDWVNRVPDILPKLPRWEILLFVDVNSNILRIGKDFKIAEDNDAYPVRIYHLVSCESAYSKADLENMTQLHNKTISVDQAWFLQMEIESEGLDRLQIKAKEKFIEDPKFYSLMDQYIMARRSVKQYVADTINKSKIK